MGQGNSKAGVVGWGTSEYGQLGSVSSSSQRSRLPRVLETLARGTHSAVSVAAAGSLSLVLLESGEVVVFGKGEAGQLGLGVGEFSAPVPRVIRSALHGKVVKSISAGLYHCAAVTDSGALYTWGRGQHGRLGHGLVEDEPAPRLVEALVGSPIALVSCGEYHTLAASVSGTLVAFGLGLAGRLGLGDEEDRLEPTIVGGPLVGKSILSVSAGGHHSAAIVAPGVLYTWGGSSFGKLGHGVDGGSNGSPKLVAGLSHTRLVQVALGQHHSAALAANGDLYVWGKSQGVRCEDVWSPEKGQNIPAISSIICGKNGAVFAITSAGDVYIRGPMSGEIQCVSAGFSPASDFTGESNRQQLYVLAGKGVVSLAVGAEHCIAMADPSRPLEMTNTEEATESTAVTENEENVTNKPSLYHVLESVVKAVPPPPARPNWDDELAFISQELKYAQNQNQKLTMRLEEAFLRIAHLERENTSLREELDATMHCLPVDRVVLETSTMSVPIVECETLE